MDDKDQDDNEIQKMCEYLKDFEISKQISKQYSKNQTNKHQTRDREDNTFSLDNTWCESETFGVKNKYYIELQKNQIHNQLNKEDIYNPINMQRDQNNNRNNTRNKSTNKVDRYKSEDDGRNKLKSKREKRKKVRPREVNNTNKDVSKQIKINEDLNQNPHKDTSLQKTNHNIDNHNYNIKYMHRGKRNNKQKRMIKHIKKEL